jgi:hypothetical protein
VVCSGPLTSAMRRRPVSYRVVVIGRLPQLDGVRVGEVERGQDQSIDEPVLQVTHYRELVLGLRARRVQHQA